MTESTTEGEESKRPPIFKDIPASVKSLRRAYRDRFRPIDPATFHSEILGESDRATVILLASLLDDALSFRIAAHFYFKPTDIEFQEIFRFEGPLGSFSSRMELALLFGFIEERTYQQLDIVREMRNACAHSKHALTFSSPELANVAKRLFTPIGFTDPPTEEDDFKSLLVMEAMILLRAVQDGSRIAGEVWGTKMLQQILAQRGASLDRPLAQWRTLRPSVQKAKVPPHQPQS